MAIRCAYCHDALPAAPWTCPACGTQLHAECADALAGRCPTLGCVKAPAPGPAKPRAWLAPLAVLLAGLASAAGVGAVLLARQTRPVQAAGGPARGPASRPAQAAPVASCVLAHVRPGQRYVFAMQNDMAQVWTVKQVGADVVSYETQMVFGGQRVGDPQASEWRWTAPLDWTPPADGSFRITRETLVVSGVRFDCMVSEANRARAWVPTAGGEWSVTFPGIIRSQMADGAIVMELVEVDPPVVVPAGRP